MNWIKVTEENYTAIKTGITVGRKNREEGFNVMEEEWVAENKFDVSHTYTIAGLTPWPEQKLRLQPNGTSETPLEVTTDELIASWWFLEE